MKKNIIICFILLCATLCVKAEVDYSKLMHESELQNVDNSGVLMNKLRACSPYVYNGNTFIAQVVGMKNRKCILRVFKHEEPVEYTYVPSDLKGIKTFSEALETLEEISQERGKNNRSRSRRR